MYFDFFLSEDQHLAHRTYLAFLSVSLWASTLRKGICAWLSCSVSSQQDLPRSPSLAV